MEAVVVLSEVQLILLRPVVEYHHHGVAGRFAEVHIDLIDRGILDEGPSLQGGVV
jgi:hypothetical protein